MDFNTESNSGKSKKQKRPAPGAGPDKSPKAPRQRPARSPGGEFNFRNPVGTFVSAARGVVLSPARFFRDLPRWGDFVSPLVFAAICLLLTEMITALLAVVVNPLLGTANPEQTLGGSLLILLLSPFIAVVGVLILTAILHLLTVLVIKPGRTDFEATLRAASYASVALLVTAPLNVIPYAGPLLALALGLVYYAVLSFLGLRELHATTARKAAIVVLIPFGLAALLVLLLTVLAVALPTFLTLRES